MGVVLIAANFDRFAVAVVDDPAKIFIKLAFPTRMDQWHPVFRGKYNVIQEMSMGHLQGTRVTHAL